MFNRPDIKTKVSQVFNNKHPGRSIRRRRPNTDGGIVYKRVLIDAKLKTGNRLKKTELYDGEGPHWTAMPSKERKKKGFIYAGPCVVNRML